jgi:hypothetical protein
MSSSIVYFDSPYLDSFSEFTPPPPFPYPGYGVVCPTSIVYFDSPYVDNNCAVSNIIPPQYPFEVNIAGRNYVVDTNFEPYRRDAFRHRSIAPQRESINFDNIAGEGTINTAGLWRRGQDDWSLGAGQQYLDRKGAVANRYYRSKGVNPWTQWQLTLLNKTRNVYQIPTDESFVKAIAVSKYVYILTANELLWTTDWTTFTTVTGMPGAGTHADITTDGTNVYVACVGGNGIYTTVSGTTSATQMVATISFSSIGYVNDRLMAGSGPKLYNITHGAQNVQLTVALTSGSAVNSIAVTNLPQAVTAGDTITIGTDTFAATDASAIGDSFIYVAGYTPSSSWAVGTNVTDSAWATNEILLFQHNNPNWIWVSFAGGSSQIYCGGYSSEGGYTDSVNGGASGVYRTTINTDGTFLTAPVIALPLEGGEFCTCLASYLNFVFVGTNFGVRMCETLNANDPTGNAGDLRSGALIPNILQPVTLPVSGVIGSGRFVYFAWNNYDTASTGIGRMDLTNFIDALAPAYASDLMITPGNGQIKLDWDPITQGPLMSLQGNEGIQQGGIWVASTQPEMSGTVESGYVGYDIPDDKVAMALGCRVQVSDPLDGTVSGYISLDASLGNTDAYRLYGITQPPKSSDVFGAGQWGLPQLRAELFQVMLRLQTGEDGETPVLSRWTLKAFPGVSTGIMISVVLLLARKVTEKGIDLPYDPYAEYEFLENLRQTQQVIQYIEGPFVRNGVIQQLDWLPNLEQNGGGTSGYDTDLIVYIQTLVDT